MTRQASDYRVGAGSSFVLLGVMRISLRFLGFRRSARFAKWLANVRPRATATGTPIQAAQAVATAAAFFPGRAVCLEQALVLFVILRRLGHQAALRVGVQPFPFQAHAWIEQDGRPLFEADDIDRKFVAFTEVFA